MTQTVRVNCDDGFHWSARKLAFYGRNSEIFSLDSLDYLAQKTFSREHAGEILEHPARHDQNQCILKKWC